MNTPAQPQAAGSSDRPAIDPTHDLLDLLDSAMGLQGRAAGFTRDTLLLGAMPELDSMAALALITGMSDHFGIRIEDDEINADIFQTVGSLVAFVERKLAR